MKFGTVRLYTCLCAQVLPDVADMIGEKTTLLTWLLTRIQPKAFDSNKQYASEVLAILVQVSIVVRDLEIGDFDMGEQL